MVVHSTVDDAPVGVVLSNRCTCLRFWSVDGYGFRCREKLPTLHIDSLIFIISNYSVQHYYSISTITLSSLPTFFIKFALFFIFMFMRCAPVFFPHYPIRSILFLLSIQCIIGSINFSNKKLDRLSWMQISFQVSANTE